MAETLERFGVRARDRFFTRDEQVYCDGRPSPLLHFAARFAAKEAFSKALGTGIARGIRWTDVEVLRDEHGRPSLLLHAHAKELAESVGATRVWVSMSHSNTSATAIVVLEGT